MASGSVAGAIRATHSMCIADVKEMLERRTGVPVEEQHLFDGGRELLAEELVSGIGGAYLSLLRSEADPFATDLGHFHVATRFKPLPEGSFTRICKLQDNAGGGVYKYVWRRDGFDDECVVVKKTRTDALMAACEAEPCERTVHLEGGHQGQPVDDPLAEIGILRYLARLPDLSPHLVGFRGVFAQDDETWVMTEYAESGELFSAVAASGSIPPESDVRRYLQQMLQAVAYLHRHSIGHRDVCLENAVIGGDGSVRLVDFSRAVMSHSGGVPLRFFRSGSRGYYRGPEVYVPRATHVQAVAPEELPRNRVAMVRAARGYFCEVRFPSEAVPGEVCESEVWGYAALPADVFALGVCFFVLAWLYPPWQKAMLSDQHFSYALMHGDSGIAKLQQAHQKPALSPEAMHLLATMLQPDPTKRPTAAACLASPWFDGGDSQ